MSGHIRVATLESKSVILDLDIGDYTVLNEVATSFWNILTGEKTQMCRELTAMSEYWDVPVGQLKTDLRRQSEEFVSSGFLSHGRERPIKIEKRPRRKYVPRPVLALMWLKHCEREVRLKRVGGLWAQVVEASPDCETSFSGEFAQTCLRAFRRAEMFHTSPRAPNDCLPRSLALFAYLRDLGLPASFHIGFDQDLSGAHAWVELGDSAVCDIDRRSRFIEFKSDNPQPC